MLKQGQNDAKKSGQDVTKKLLDYSFEFCQYVKKKVEKQISELNQEVFLRTDFFFLFLLASFMYF